MSALVSVVIPVFNGEAFIAGTLQSAITQTYENCEFIIIDDGSTDHTADILSAFAARDKRIRIISQANQGACEARNIGIGEACGKYIAFLDADDLWNPEKIIIQLARLEETPALGAVYSLHRRIDDQNKVIDNSLVWGIAGPCLARHMLAKPVGCGSNLMVRADLVQTISGFDPSYTKTGGGEDLELEIRLAERAEMAEIPLYHVGYRVHTGNSSRDQVGLAHGLLRVYRDALSRHNCIPTRVRNQIMARGYRSLAGSQLKVRNYLAGIRAAITAFVLDPKFVMSRATEMRAKLKRRQSLIAGVESFVSCSPADGHNFPLPIMRSRMEKYISLDRNLGAKINSI